MKKIFVSIFLISLSFFCFAQNLSHDDGMILYQDALTAYEKSDYGRALKLCEDAILTRKQHISNEIEVLNKALQPRQVQRAGNSIVDVLKVLSQRDDYDAINIINYYSKKKGESFFNDSISNLLAYLDSIKVFPESQKLIGDIYKIEGEYEFAKTYYLEALKNSQVLDIPDQKYEILYLLADVDALQNGEKNREDYLKSILSGDKYYADKHFQSVMVRTIRSEKSNSLESFFNMFRADNYYMLEAYQEYADFYFQKGDYQNALNFAALNSITGFTKIIDIVKLRNINYEYGGLQTVLYEASLYDDVKKWGRDNNVWGNFVFLADVAYKSGAPIFAINLLQVLVEFLPDDYYQRQAVILLDSIKD